MTAFAYFDVALRDLSNSGDINCIKVCMASGLFTALQVGYIVARVASTPDHGWINVSTR